MLKKKQNKKMKFSVIIPLYNKAPYVRKALETVCAQTYRDYEIIVINDGSTDNSSIIAEEYLKGIGGVNYKILQQKNAGVAAARNNGVAQANGDYLAFLDADDWWKPTYLERMAQLIEDYPDAGLYASNYFYHKDGKNIVKVKNVKTGYINYPKTYFETFAMPVWTGATIVPRNIYYLSGGFRTHIRMSEDFDLWIRIALLSKVVFLNDPLAYYNQNVQLKWRALGKLYSPKVQFAFNADYLIPYQKQNIDIKHVVDMVKIVCLKQYYISVKYHELAKNELSKVDIDEYKDKTYASYIWEPIWKLRIISFLEYIYQLMNNR